MTPLIENPIVEHVGGKWWRLTKPLRCFDDQFGYIVIPEGFRTDFDSVPRLPFAHMLLKGRTVTAAIVHDYAYQTGTVAGQRISRAEADMLFLRLMGDEGVAWWRRSLIFTGVRVGGWLSWRKHRG